ncbi:hypothetical protein Ancab_002916 [Ancistrocladus abbreviatus]
MAALTKSRTLIYNLKSKLRSLGIVPCHNYPTSSSTHHRPTPSRPESLTNPEAILSNSATLFVSRHFESTKAQTHLDSHLSYDDQVLDFPGGKIGMTSELRFISESNDRRVPCYRVLDDNGRPCGDFIERQGRISFYVTTIGEEAINIASAAALSMDDLVFPQYREPGVLLWRGFTVQEFANQCFSNRADYGKGRQMPIHYGCRKLNYITVSSTVGTQLSHAVGAAYSSKMDKKDACVITYFGDGGTSTGDFHAALNFAAVLEAPVIFFCRNNGWAISTPVSDQLRSDGIVVRGQGYGIQSIRVDGNDALAIYNAVHEARRMAILEQQPILIEAMTYRAGHHSTSDDSTKYRSIEEIEQWRKARDPVTRFRKWIEGNGWWNDHEESELQLRNDVRQQVLEAIQVAEKLEKPPVSELFTDVYDALPTNLWQQEKLVRETIERHPDEYPSNFPW